MPRRAIPELLPLRKACGLVLEELCLTTGINYEYFFYHLAKALGNDEESDHTQSYRRSIPQSYLLEHFSIFVQCIDSAVKACSTDDNITAYVREKIEENWTNDREKFLDLLYEKNKEARTIVLNLKFRN